MSNAGNMKKTSFSAPKKVNIRLNRGSFCPIDAVFTLSYCEGEGGHLAYQFAPTDGFFDFDRLCRRFTPRIQRAVLDRTGDAYLAEDVAQETLFRVYRYRDHFDPGRPVWPWLFTVSARVCANMLRGKRPRIEPLSAKLDGELSAVFPDPNLDPEEQMVANEGEALATLSPRYRSVLISRYVDGLSYEQIARQEGISVPGIDSLLLRARRRFRDAVKAQKGQLQLVIVLPIQRLLARLRAGAERAQQRTADATAWLSLDAAALAATTGIAVAAVALAGAITAPPTEAGTPPATVMRMPAGILTAAGSSHIASTHLSSTPAVTETASGSRAPTDPITLENAVKPSIKTDPPDDGGVAPSSTEVELHIYDPVTGDELGSAGTGIPCERAGSYLLPQSGPIRTAC